MEGMDIYMIGVCVDKGDRVTGFRLLDVNTMHTMDATYISAFNAIKYNKIDIRNLFIKNEKVVERGDVLERYPKIICGSAIFSDILTIIGAENNDSVICSDVHGNKKIINKKCLENLSKYNIRLSNKYMENEILFNCIKIKQEQHIDIDIDAIINKIDSKYRLLGIVPPKIENINGNITLVKADRFIESIVVQSPVTHIGESAFDMCLGLKDVKLGKGIKYIGDYAFNRCASLKHINIPDSVDKIGNGVFNKTGLIDIDINISNIPESTFDSCIYLSKVKLGSRVNKIGDFAFENCGSLKSIVIPETVSEIGSGAFSNSGLVEIIINSDISIIESDTFKRCLDLKELTLSDTIEVIGDHAFYECKNIINIKVKGSNNKGIRIPDGLRHIGIGAFEGCTKLKEIDIPRGVKRILDFTFDKCYCLERINLGNVEGIGKFAFSECGKLRYIKIPDTVRVIGIYAFHSTGLLEIDINNRFEVLINQILEGCRSIEKINITS